MLMSAITMRSTVQILQIWNPGAVRQWIDAKGTVLPRFKG